jgi:phage terminase large subunit-like protein
VFATWEADIVVYEDNLGKAWMKKVLVDAYEELREAGLFPAESTPPLKSVHSNQGKKTRAERFALRYQQGRVHHVGEFPTLERQQVTFDPESSKESPDRMDAAVHGANWLMDGEKKRVKVATPARRTVSAASPSRMPTAGMIPRTPWS